MSKEDCTLLVAGAFMAALGSQPIFPVLEDIKHNKCIIFSTQFLIRIFTFL
jgi:hypothetical protein